MLNLATQTGFGLGDFFTGVSVLIAMLALFVSCASAYFAHFHKRIKLFVASSHMMTKDGSLEFCLTNGSNISLTITEFDLWYEIEKDKHSIGVICQLEFEEPNMKAIHLKSGEHAIVQMKKTQNLGTDKIKLLLEHGRVTEFPLPEPDNIVYEFPIYLTMSTTLETGKRVQTRSLVGDSSFSSKGELRGLGSEGDIGNVFEGYNLCLERLSRWVDKVLNLPDDANRPKICQLLKCHDEQETC